MGTFVGQAGSVDCQLCFAGLFVFPSPFRRKRASRSTLFLVCFVLLDSGSESQWDKARNNTSHSHAVKSTVAESSARRECGPPPPFRPQ